MKHLHSDGHGRDETRFGFFIRPVRLAKDFISRSQAFGARPAGVPRHLVHVMVEKHLVPYKKNLVRPGTKAQTKARDEYPGRLVSCP
jgi:hypothetical protein